MLNGQLLAATAGAPTASAPAEAIKMRIVSREVFIPSPGPGIGVMAASYYTTLSGKDLIATYGHIARSDTVDIGYRKFSSDGGKTWSGPQEVVTKQTVPGGTIRRYERGGYVEPRSGRYVSFATHAMLTKGDAADRMVNWQMYYAVSEDGGKTDLVSEQIICEGAEFTADHPAPGIYRGKSGVMMGDRGQRPLTRDDGAILLPVQASRVGPDDAYYNPTGELTFTDCMVLIGRWRSDKHLSWTASARVEGDASLSSRGFFEPTLAILDGGRILMVMRGSNSRIARPGYRWASVSDDGGMTWTKPKAWTYDDGSAFFSPSSCSQLILHSSGRLLWAGNICKQNPSGNGPRYPIVLGEVDHKTGLLIRSSVGIIDDRQEGEAAALTLSNFLLREDMATGELLLHMTRLFAKTKDPKKLDWTSDAMLYRIKLD